MSGHGGAGGVIILDNFEVNLKHVKAINGHSLINRTCASGSAGTIYYKRQDLLIVDNEDLNLTHATVITLTDKTVDQVNLIVYQLILNSLVRIKTTDCIYLDRIRARMIEYDNL